MTEVKGHAESNTLLQKMEKAVIIKYKSYFILQKFLPAVASKSL